VGRCQRRTLTLNTQSLPFPLAATVEVGFVTGPSSIDRETIDTQLKIFQAYTDDKMAYLDSTAGSFCSDRHCCWWLHGVLRRASM
jgi:hypothetical protein